MKDLVKGLVLFGLLILLVSSVNAADKVVVGDNLYGCVSRGYFDKLADYAVQKDAQAFKKGLVDGVMLGQCYLFQAGEPVFVIDTASFAGLSKVRRVGNVVEYWTWSKALK